MTYNLLFYPPHAWKQIVHPKTGTPCRETCYVPQLLSELKAFKNQSLFTERKFFKILQQLQNYVCVCVGMIEREERESEREGRERS